MNSTSAFKPAVRLATVVLPFFLFAVSAAASNSDPCAAGKSRLQCQQAQKVRALHEEASHGAGQAHARAAANANNPGPASELESTSLAVVSESVPADAARAPVVRESSGNWSDRIHSGEAHPVRGSARERRSRR